MSNILNAQEIVAHMKSVSSDNSDSSGSPAECQVYFAQDIQKFLGIGRSRCYTYLEEVYKKQEPFRVIKVGKLFRIPKQSFDNWLHGCG